MPVVIVVGVQWGDEGKGKIVDYLTESANLVVRFQGGNNAGHTVIVEGQKAALRLIPSGILRKGTRCLLAAGVVLDPFALLEEFETLKEIGIEITPDRLGIAGETQLILPYHKVIDGAREERRASEKIGTTKKGIGPSYEDSVARFGIRLVDLSRKDSLKALLERNVKHKNAYLENVLGSDIKFDAEELYQSLLPVAERLSPYVANVSLEVSRAIEDKTFVVFEGAQGSLLDIHHGTYPYVTSSNTVAGFACASAGFSPKSVSQVLGICKAYATRVGEGPFPTEDDTEVGDRLRDVGKEYGTVTKRPRRCGWFDLVAVKKAVRLNGIDSLVLTKLDVLSGISPLKIGKSYQVDGKELVDVPALSSELEEVEVEYEEHPGWEEDITGVQTFADLPQAAQNFIKRVEELVACPVGGFSVGPERKQTILIDRELKKLANTS